MTYTVGIYRGKLNPSKSFIDYAIFVAFFPRLVAGPILRAHEFLPQLREKIQQSKTGVKLRQILIHNTNLKFGITLMAFGFLKKMFFADNIAPLVNEIFANPTTMDSFSIIIATIAFGIQIYGDFSGYSDIAIGAAYILGFKIPINFNKPYFATSPADFWRKWHISLSTWLRDYLYIPLGGNRQSNTRTYLNLFIVMFLGGLWHGASWNFVIWGMLHGFYLAAHKFLQNTFPKLTNNSIFKTKIGKIILILATQYLVFLAWIPFRVRDFNNTIYSMQKYVFFDFQIDGIMDFIIVHKFPLMIISLFFLFHLFEKLKPNMVESISKFK